MELRSLGGDTEQTKSMLNILLSGHTLRYFRLGEMFEKNVC